MNLTYNTTTSWDEILDLGNGTYMLTINAAASIFNEAGNESVSYAVTIEQGPCIGNIDGDDVVGPGDLANLLASWGATPACPPYSPADLNSDCSVGPADLAILLASWGACTG